MKPEPMPNAPPRQQTSGAWTSRLRPACPFGQPDDRFRPTCDSVRIAARSITERSLLVIPRLTPNGSRYSYDNLAVGMSSSTVCAPLSRLRTTLVRSMVLCGPARSPWPMWEASNRRRGVRVEKRRPDSPPRAAALPRAARPHVVVSRAHMKYLTVATDRFGLRARCEQVCPVGPRQPPGRDRWPGSRVSARLLAQAPSGR
jgi:hypothetical protein